MKIEKRCSVCTRVHYLTVSIEGYRAWKSGIMIQKALNELSEDDRELLISGICGECFDKITGDDEN